MIGDSMPKKPSGQHERELKHFCEELRQRGFHVVETFGKIPNAIATKDNKLYAVELLVKIKRPRDKQGQSRGWRLMGGYTITGKQANYAMYDDLLIKQVYKEG